MMSTGHDAPVALSESLARLQSAVEAAATAGDDLALVCQADTTEDLLRNLSHLFEARSPAIASLPAEPALAEGETPPGAASGDPTSDPIRVRRKHRVRRASRGKWWKKHQRLISLCAAYLFLMVGGYLLFGFFKLLILSLSD